MKSTLSSDITIIGLLLLLQSPNLSAAKELSTPMLEEVVITAQRREESLQQAPLAVSVFSKEALKTGQVSDIGDIQNWVPNLTLHVGDASNAVVYIRGVGQIDSLSFADPGIGIYLDDVYLGRAQGSFLDVYDIERIEVLRGPQGTLYGRNTIGGAVKYISVKPTGSFTSDIEATVGNYNRQELKATISGPLIHKQLLGKISVASISHDGYSENSVENLNGSKMDGDRDALLWRGFLQYQASDNVQIDLSLDGSTEKPEASRTPARETAVFGVPANSDPFKIEANFNDLNEMVVFGSALTISWSISNNLHLKSISAFRSLDYETHLDLDATAMSVFGIFVDQDQEQFSQEFQLSFDNGGVFSWLAGLYHFREHDVTESGIFGPLIELITNSENDQLNKSYAVFGQAYYSFHPKLKLTAGLRSTKENKRFKRSQEIYVPTPFPPTLGEGTVITSVDTEDDWSNLSPRLALEYQLSEGVMTYASASRGFKSGGFDGRSSVPAQALPYEPENLWSYEAGIKSELLQQRLRLNALLFYNDYEDLQLSDFGSDPETGAFQPLFSNAGKASMKGVELEVSALATDFLTINASLGYLDGQYDEYIGPDGEDISNQHELVNAPKWTVRLAPQYRILLSSLSGSSTSRSAGELILAADLSYRSKTYTTVSSSETLSQSAYGLIDVSISYISANQHWRVMLGGKNLGDKRYINHAFDLSDSLDYQLAYYGDPRTYQLHLGYHY